MLKRLFTTFVFAFLLFSCSNGSSNGQSASENEKVEVPCNIENEGMIIKPADSDSDHLCKEGTWVNVSNISSSSTKSIYSSSSKTTRDKKTSSSSVTMLRSSSSNETKMFLCENGTTYVLDLASCDKESPSSKIIDYLPIDDSEYSYAGIPRIVIETEDHREIKDRETEIPAKLQIWGEKAPESEIMELTIKGRGNSTWGKPKKPYTIKFDEKQSLLGMPEAKKWVLLANYLDRTLIRNSVAFEIAKKTNLEWTPSGKFAEVFLNGKFLGNYFICEKIQINKNRLNINKDSYLLEFDANYDEEFKFRTSINDLPVNIKNPDVLSEKQLTYITTYIDTIECILYGECKDLTIEDYIDFQSFADFLIVFELSENSEPLHPKSVFMYKDTGLLKAGPVWDFDWGTFTERKVNGWRINRALWYSALLRNQPFRKSVQDNWAQYKNDLEQIPQFIDSLADYIKESNDRNIALWPINTQSPDFPDKDKDFEEAISMMKQAYSMRMTILDSLFSGL